ncbi:MAG TPA: hypothetical protein VFN42_12975, partial [Acetobacteraceae bacterium]|nr:hypothetical protein [Acetobacteraceae bacterium]
MPDTDHVRWDETAEADAFCRQPWEDDPAPDHDPLLHPAWDDLPDEITPPAPPLRSRSAPTHRAADAHGLLAPLAAAQDALARLDASAEAAPDPIRIGLIARLALREAAGWLASQSAWVHPHDLALRIANLAGRFDTAAQIARPRTTLPGTISAIPGGWDDPEDLAALARGELAAVRALALSRLLAALPRRHDPLATPETAAALLGPLGAGALEPDRFAAWRAAHLPGRGRSGTSRAPALPPLLQAADAALAWMESGASDEPDALAALALAALLLTRSGTPRIIPLPFWAAWPALGHPVGEGLPRLRPAVARDSAGMERVPWPAVFLTFVAEAARAGLRELGRLRAAAAAGAALGKGLDKRSRLPAAVTLVLAAPVVTARDLATRLGITPQAANRILG